MLSKGKRNVISKAVSYYTVQFHFIYLKSAIFFAVSEVWCCSVVCCSFCRPIHVPVLQCALRVSGILKLFVTKIYVHRWVAPTCVPKLFSTFWRFFGKFNKIVSWRPQGWRPHTKTWIRQWLRVATLRSRQNSLSFPCVFSSTKK